MRVGKEPEHTDFLLHEGIICERSEFFRRAMSGNWIEKEERLVKLPEERPLVFDMYVSLLYTNRTLDCEQSTEGEIEPKAFRNVQQKQYRALCKLYVLAEMLQDLEAKKAALKAMITTSQMYIEQSWWKPNEHFVRDLYGSTPRGSPARRWLVDIWSNVKASSLESYGADSLPNEFLLDLAVLWRSDPKANFSKIRKKARSAKVGDYFGKRVDDSSTRD